MKHTINVEGINIHAYHGCNEEEARIGGNYIIDVKLVCDFTDAAMSDDLAQTIDYCAVYEVCKREMQTRSNLIEQVGQRIFDALKDEFNQIIDLRVKLTKLKPPIPGDVNQVSVEIEDN